MRNPQLATFVSSCFSRLRSFVATDLESVGSWEDKVRVKPNFSSSREFGKSAERMKGLTILLAPACRYFSLCGSQFSHCPPSDEG